uniref:PHP n=1 Tax=Araucaria cunninghamii TaxID=56994 RepID=A0A0D6R9S5_ARACU
MDPLTVLRDFTIRGDLDKITRVADEFRFGDEYRFPCSAETAYRAKQGGLYNLESLFFFVKNQHLKHSEYFQQARALKLQVVTLPDRKPLLEYLHGHVASTDAIEPVVPPEPHPETAMGVEEYRPDDPAILAGAGFFKGRENELAGKNYIELIRAVEKPLIDRESLLECKNKNFQSVISVASKKDEERKRVERNLPTPGVKRPYDEKTSLGLGFWKEAQDLGIDTMQSYLKKDGMKNIYARPSSTAVKGIGEGVPIIIVPPAFNTLLNIYNAKEFLEDGVYYPPDVKAKEMGSKPECVTIQKKFNREKGVSTFEVRNKPGALSQEDWGRVAAVFVLGKEWQFRDWPFKDHVEIFNKLLGFYLRFEDDSVESAKTVRQWNVKIISISKHKRHQDKAAALEIWNRLEEFMRSRRSTANF